MVPERLTLHLEISGKLKVLQSLRKEEAMGNDGEDMELEMLRQAALKSLQRNREKKASAKVSLLPEEL